MISVGRQVLQRNVRYIDEEVIEECILLRIFKKNALNVVLSKVVLIFTESFEFVV